MASDHLHQSHSTTILASYELYVAQDTLRLRASRVCCAPLAAGPFHSFSGELELFSSQLKLEIVQGIIIQSFFYFSRRGQGRRDGHS